MTSPFAPIGSINSKPGLSVVNPSTAFSTSQAEKKEGGFDNVFAGFLNNVNDTQLKAGDYTKALVTGNLENTHEMTIAGAKSEVMLHLCTQVASKLSSAATQLFQMQI